jgi:hypothetical protein
VIRSSIIGICSSLSRLATVAAPYIQLLGEEYSDNIPFIVYGSLACSSAILYFIFINESKDIILNDTLQDSKDVEEI